MGIVHGDSDGLPDVAITHFFGEHQTLWRSQSGGADGGLYSQDQTNEAGLSAPTRNFTGWGAAFADFDLDGRLDLVATNGHIRREPGQVYPLENPPIIFHNRGGGRFTDASSGRAPISRPCTWAAAWPAATSTTTATSTSSSSITTSPA